MGSLRWIHVDSDIPAQQVMTRSIRSNHQTNQIRDISQNDCSVCFKKSNVMKEKEKAGKSSRWGRIDTRASHGT